MYTLNSGGNPVDRAIRQPGNHLSDGFCRVLITSYQKKASDKLLQHALIAL